ncbi:hypothetical protein K3725_00090 [Leisingera sp. S132]|uniref:ATP-grasp domain-containing protein n=1 Tax=Leisingera sp. S132 TaxID=2867016 RepID=UPI0021A3A0B8|nr:hypothetical protein [Leisingera sp. S132]UWQ79453.1 hypothetical protein K3725_00090 [Leisingera sp. S132]
MRVLLLDAAFAVEPIHRYLIGQGHQVWTISNRPHDTLALSYPNQWIRGDYSDVSLVQDQIIRLGIEAVIPGCTDVSMETFTQLPQSDFFSYPSSADQVLGKKSLFRGLCAELELPAPQAFETDALPDDGILICKPCDSFSGRGVTVFEAVDREARDQAIARAKANSPSGEVVCENFVQGQLYSFTAFIEHGQVVNAFVVREGSHYDPFAVDTSYVAHDFSPALFDDCKAAVEAVAGRLQLCDGLIHTQFISDGSGIALIEMSRRCPGDLYPMLIEYSTGFPFAARYASYFLGQAGPAWSAKSRPVLRHTIKHPGGRPFPGFGPLPCAGLMELVPTVRAGERLPDSPAARVAVSFYDLAESQALERAYTQLAQS